MRTWARARAARGRPAPSGDHAGDLRRRFAEETSPEAGSWETGPGRGGSLRVEEARPGGRGGCSAGRAAQLSGPETTDPAPGIRRLWARKWTDHRRNDEARPGGTRAGLGWSGMERGEAR